jgi:hypothetical protein
VEAGVCDERIEMEMTQDDIDSIRAFSQQLGIKEFLIRLSDRFDSTTEHFMPDPLLLRDRYQSMINWKQTKTTLGIDPKCHNGQQHFITAEGYYSPCCWIADHRFYYKSPFGKNKKQYNILNHTLAEILQQPQTVEFYQTLDQQSGCQYNCPKIAG